MRYEIRLRFTGKKPEPGRCVKCGCTDDAACDEGCYWVDNGELLCSACLNALLEAAPGYRGFSLGRVHDEGGELLEFVAGVRPGASR